MHDLYQYFYIATVFRYSNYNSSEYVALAGGFHLPGIVHISTTSKQT